MPNVCLNKFFKKKIETIDENKHIQLQKSNRTAKVLSRLINYVISVLFLTAEILNVLTRQFRQVFGVLKIF